MTGVAASGGIMMRLSSAEPNCRFAPADQFKVIDSSEANVAMPFFIFCCDTQSIGTNCLHPGIVYAETGASMHALSKPGKRMLY